MPRGPHGAEGLRPFPATGAPPARASAGSDTGRTGEGGALRGAWDLDLHQQRSQPSRWWTGCRGKVVEQAGSISPASWSWSLGGTAASWSMVYFPTQLARGRGPAGKHRWVGPTEIQPIDSRTCLPTGATPNLDLPPYSGPLPSPVQPRLTRPTLPRQDNPHLPLPATFPPAGGFRMQAQVEGTESRQPAGGPTHGGRGISTQAQVSLSAGPPIKESLPSPRSQADAQ